MDRQTDRNTEKREVRHCLLKMHYTTNMFVTVCYRELVVERVQQKIALLFSRILHGDLDSSCHLRRTPSESRQ